MKNRQSNSSYDGKIEHAKVAIGMDPKTLEQFSTSGIAAKRNRAKITAPGIDDALQDIENDEQARNEQSKGEGQGPGQRK
ncbi:hypothetical protein N7535_006431 [Penicillium sp. DV-2018c]|nr:hypothetical protein N7461_007491 [Penicillium sp. DV-2018c]KAJ5567125.1 hypothetical protein N7535_006431 [Penicillium sp. DV-2018c]